MKLLFASSNVNKIKEIRALLPAGYVLETLAGKGYHLPLEETGSTLVENALQKARFVYSLYRMMCFADDSGLEVSALDGAPGVHTAYYAGLPRNEERNMDLLLEQLKGKENRSAVFKTVIALKTGMDEYVFEGKLEGTIANEKKGMNGFGYDPVFIPEGSSKTLAELSGEEKNAISHRSRAVAKLMEFLQIRK